MFLSKLQNVHVKITKCVGPKYKMYLSKPITITKFICLDCSALIVVI